MNDIIGKKLEKIRIDKVIPHIEGNLLDIGCGNNQLTKTYGQGIGVDVFDWGNVDILVEDTSNIPLKDKSFNTITIIAALNHIPNRDKVIKECHRLLDINGKLIITMIPPNISRIWHFLRKPWDIDQKERGMKDGEVFGMKEKQVISLMEANKFKITKVSYFMARINKLYICQKK
ncbi:class I SAM-dependent methyltransferase [Lutibacter sp. B1]|uniref:class I SAM-dependent methyltransferase n=1 Tax=Lutibacter sp. B1 TaxID=2725996 RepID=UPI00210F8A68|nr:class I SAM-dependent methyltransferase [Lutibacter sp. B1]